MELIKKHLILIVHNVRSAHNVGSIFRSADAFGVEQLILTGYTPYPLSQNDKRLPHETTAVANKISKTALGAEAYVGWQHQPAIEPVIARLRRAGYTIAALEQTATAQNLSAYKCPARLALIVGREVEGVEPDILKLTDLQLQIPMMGQKESLNVAVAAAVAMYQVHFS
jgi:23S rRNA (guanosine2251-2'-O)-methyltransferase